jgi:hypothetical protein
VQLAAIDMLEIKPAGGGEDEQCAPWREVPSSLVRAGEGAEDGSVDRSVRNASHPFRLVVDREHVIAAVPENSGEEPTDEAVPEDQYSTARHAFRAPQDAGEWLCVGRMRIIERGRKVDPCPRRRPLRQPTGLDRRRAELLARRFMACAAAFTLAAWQVVNEHDATAVRIGDDLVAENRTRGGVADLLDIGAAQPAGTHVHALPVPFRLCDLTQKGLPISIENDGAHGGIVGTVSRARRGSVTFVPQRRVTTRFCRGRGRFGH